MEAELALAAALDSPRSEAPGFRRIRFQSIGLPVGLLACVVLWLGAARDQVTVAAGVALALMAGAVLVLVVVGRRELLRLTRNHEQAAALARARAEALWACEQHARAVFQVAHDGLFIVDDAGRVMDANPAAAALVGKARASLLATRFA